MLHVTVGLGLLRARVHRPPTVQSELHIYTHVVGLIRSPPFPSVCMLRAHSIYCNESLT